MNEKNISIIGAGSATFSTRIIKDLCMTQSMHGATVTFMDIDQHKLDMVYNLAERLADEMKAEFVFKKTIGQREALDGANFIINTAQIGGHAYAEACRNLGTKHGYYRGTWLHYLRQMVFFSELAQEIEQVCPQALLIQSANPVFEGGTMLARTSKVNVIGLCHGHHGIQNVAKALGLDPEKADGRAVGFNHWIWLSRFTYDGHDAMPILENWIQEHKNDDLSHQYDLGKAAVEQYRLFGMLPIGDTARMAAWWMHQDFESKQCWFGETGGMDSHIGWQRHLDRLADTNSKIEAIAHDPNQRVTDIFGAKPSGEQIVPIINSIINNEKGIYQVNIPNEGFIIKGIPEDVVVECQAMIDVFGLHPVQEKPFPKNLMIKAMIPRWSFAELLVESVVQHDAGLLLHHLLADHRTHSYEQAEAYLNAWLNMEGNCAMKNYFAQ